ARIHDEVVGTGHRYWPAIAFEDREIRPIFDRRIGSVASNDGAVQRCGEGFIIIAANHTTAFGTRILRETLIVQRGVVSGDGAVLKRHFRPETYQTTTQGGIVATDGGVGYGDIAIG